MDIKEKYYNKNMDDISSSKPIILKNVDIENSLLLNNNKHNDKIKNNINNYSCNPDLLFNTKNRCNIDISNNIRYNNSNKIFKDYKIEKEKEDICLYKYQFLDKNIQDPKNIIMPFPRGGDSTRKIINNNDVKDYTFNAPIKKNIYDPINFSSNQLSNNYNFNY